LSFCYRRAQNRRRINAIVPNAAVVTQIAAPSSGTDETMELTIEKI
jgi:hypothetical protein